MIIKSFFTGILFIQLVKSEILKDKRPNWCKRNQFKLRFKKLCEKENSKVKTEFCEKTCCKITESCEDYERTLYYTRESGKLIGKIYKYKIKSNGEATYSGEFDCPYEIGKPNLYISSRAQLVFNDDRKVLEIIGESRDHDGINDNHYHLSEDGQFSKFTSSWYEPDAFSTLVFIPNVGTISIAGKRQRNTVHSLYIIQIQY